MVWVLYTNNEERDIGTANAPLTDDHSIRVWVLYTGFSKSLIYWVVKFVCIALLYFKHFTIGSQLNSLNVSADGALKAACNNTRAARF